MTAAPTYDKENSVNAITDKGETISVTKYGYGQETLYISQDGKQYLQNAVSLELTPATEVDDEMVNQPVTPEGPGVITSSLPGEPKKAAKANK